ncbi:phospholipid-transporting ATPase IF-like [Penaeus chinensis]|uniref:phospholipid-transporting ATPase IF-like n=1 Tax=Penaeus chinensis TaxID=139456 RepID=UPI001FB6C21D|nr:phospholipid-transporting ATPase IF-like [Penaeus chinensis]XP_047469991.1 phospholipid-transporting ATPase IF-like [Penaeus chinensis]XP_047469993.1 phospholipid-transporting ATPase IF-like [Penaeus chinensis]
MPSLRRKNKDKANASRTLFVNRIPPEEMADPAVIPKYMSNNIKTSKYTFINFIPKNLFEQFRRIANFYFLCVAIIQVSIESPVSPMTSILPLVFVITVTGVKQAYEDWLRHREDNKVNKAPARVLREGAMTNVLTSQIQVGDIVEVQKDEQFPCDLLLLASTNSEGTCDVTTANLDGETNLKTFTSPPDTRHLDTPEDLATMRALIECQLPHANLYDFKGRMDMYKGNAEPTKMSLATENLLLRGARLKNTPVVYGVSVYTGEETKMALNTKMTSNKFSTVEKSMNYFLVFFLVLLILEIVICTVLKYQLYGTEFTKDAWYFQLREENSTLTVTARDVVQDSFSFLVLFNYIIPISLYVTLELQKFFGAMFLEWDDDLRCTTTRERAKCNTSDLNEELGQVQYLFTDKTGTLTENIMHFRHCSVDGAKYIDVDGDIHSLNDRNNKASPLPSLPKTLEIFLETLALCHTVQVTTREKDTGEVIASSDEMELAEMKLEYQAASPDEKALVEACARYGVVFEGQSHDRLLLSVRGERRTFTRLQILEFDSDRKCMSVAVRDESSRKIWLLTKGAESSVLKRCSVSEQASRSLRDTTLKHINDYAMLGLRTLAVARRELTDKQYEDFATQLSQARQTLDNREEAVRKVSDRMEADLTLLGATGVEDLLQDGVQETLESLRAAGIKVWVLTGDKVETAVNIAYSCGHFKGFMTILTLTGLQEEDAEAKLQECDAESQKSDGHYGLVVDGSSLQVLLDHHRRRFYDVCRRCTAVVCCRMSPRQKAETVRLVKTSGKNPVCAAIGDGANDVSMIQEAHVGLGVMGKEGRQAVRCADFAFARFKFLKKVLLVHGHWFYTRVSTLVQYSFYKNVAFITPQLYFATMSAFSTQPVYDSLALTMFNITFTSLPVFVFGLFDQNLPAELLMSRPHLYQRIANNAAMSWLIFFKWTLFALWHTVVMYFGLYFVYADDTPGFSNGQTPDLFLFGTTLISICVVVTNLKLVLEAHYFTNFFVLSVVLSLLFYAVQCLIYHGVWIPDYGSLQPDVFWSYYRMFESPALMLASVLLGVVCLIPDLVDKVVLGSNDERVKFRRQKMESSEVSATRYATYVNEAFTYTEEDEAV